MRNNRMRPFFAFAASAAITSAASAQRLPDLYVYSFKTNKSVLRPGDRVETKTLVQNLGSVAAGAFRTGIYVSTNAAISTSDTLTGSFLMSGLAIHTGREITQNVTIAKRVPDGRTWFGAYADSANAVRERNEGNNGKGVAVRTQGVVDLGVEQVSVAGTSWPKGGAVRVSSKIRNEGGKAPGRTTSTGYYLSQNRVISNTDRLLGSWNLGNIAAGSYMSHTARPLIPRSQPRGACWIGVLADRHGHVAEVNEINNFKAVPGRCYDAGAFAAFGASCPGAKTNGTPRLAATNPNGHPQVGSTSTYRLTSGPRSSAALFLIGASKTSWGPFTLPLSLAPFGATRCSLFVGMDIQVLRSVDTRGMSSLGLPVPNDNRLVGLTYHMQAAGVDRQANRLGLSWTNGLTTKVGSAK